MRAFAIAWLAAACLIPSAASAQGNVSFGAAHSLVPGGTPAEAMVDTVHTHRWYSFTSVAGRSYCVETQGGVHFDTSATAWTNDTKIEVWGENAEGHLGTAIGNSVDPATEPFGQHLASFCWVAPATERTFFSVSAYADDQTFNFRVRVVETTMFSPWFFVGGSYNAFTVLRNTTNSTIPFTINWRNGAGAIVGTVSGTLPPNGGSFYPAAAVENPGVIAAGNGTVEIVFVGSPQAIVANTTVLSNTTGLSFDAPFTQRATW
jgi:hypothetical protein